jgi:hypothetical protein
MINIPVDAGATIIAGQVEEVRVQSDALDVGVHGGIIPRI